MSEVPLYSHTRGSPLEADVPETAHTSNVYINDFSPPEAGPSSQIPQVASRRIRPTSWEFDPLEVLGRSQGPKVERFRPLAT